MRIDKRNQISVQVRVVDATAEDGWRVITQGKDGVKCRFVGYGMPDAALQAYVPRGSGNVRRFTRAGPVRT
jgi:hypothetical protein